MKQEDAKRYAEAMQKRMGDTHTTYSAILSHEYQTWVVKMYSIFGEDHSETLFMTENELINYLIGYAGYAMKMK